MSTTASEPSSLFVALLIISVISVAPKENRAKPKSTMSSSRRISCSSSAHLSRTTPALQWCTATPTITTEETRHYGSPPPLRPSQGTPPQACHAHSSYATEHDENVSRIFLPIIPDDLDDDMLFAIDDKNETFARPPMPLAFRPRPLVSSSQVMFLPIQDVSPMVPTLLDDDDSNNNEEEATRTRPLGMKENRSSPVFDPNC